MPYNFYKEFTPAELPGKGKYVMIKGEFLRESMNFAVRLRGYVADRFHGSFLLGGHADPHAVA